MPGHGFGGGNRDGISLFSKYSFNGSCFALIIERRGGSVCIDIADIINLQVRIFQSQLHGHGRAGTVFCWAEIWWASSVVPYPLSSARIFAPRACACSSDSKISMPAPSPIKNPSRSLSNGREAV